MRPRKEPLSIPYYTGEEQKLAQNASTTGNYLYQNWLVFLNSARGKIQFNENGRQLACWHRAGSRISAF